MSEYDVIVMGGGPAGSTVATLVARQGSRVLLLDRERFPRFRIGESLMPATYWTLQRLGVLDKMRKTPFPRKHSVQFFSKSGRAGSPFYFSEFESHESSVSWQVERGEFDRMLLEHSRENGVEVREAANVREVLFDGARATGVRVAFDDGSTVAIPAKVIVDATGQTAIIARQLQLKNHDPELRHASFFTRYRGARRDCGIDEGATLILQTEHPKTWFWYIPLPDDVVSVGVVGPLEHLMRGRKGDPQTVYDEELQTCPALEARICDATQLTDVGVMRDFSYVSHQIAGDGWVMAGDAFGFLDPIYSSGVFLAMKSAEFAADAINDAAQHDDFSAVRLSRNGARYLEGMESMRKLVYAYYNEEFSFHRFLERFPECKENLVDLLIGNVFRKSTEGIFDSMSTMCELPESRTLRSEQRTS